MAITDKTRKLLWGNAASRCAICQHELVVKATNNDDESVIGEECHIVAREQKGPRGNYPLSLNERDDYNNLILLCRNHHKEIDDQEKKYTVERLHTIKADHESWVKKKLSLKKSSEPEQFFIFRVDSGAQICNTVISCDAFHPDNNEQLQTQEEAETIANFVQNVHDYLDIWSAITSRDRIDAQWEMEQQLKQINTCGFLVYAAQQRRSLRSSNLSVPLDIDIGYLVIIRKTNPLVKRKDEQIEQLIKLNEQLASEFTNFIISVIPKSLINQTSLNLASNTPHYQSASSGIGYDLISYFP